MKLSAIAASTALAISGVRADADDTFITALVSDYANHQTQYFSFLMTATGYPSDLTKLALEVTKYTDDGYTTLLDSSQVDELRSYVTNFPWYSSRLEAVATATGSGSESTADSDSSAAAGSGASSGASATSGSGSGSASASSGSKSASSSKAASSSAASSSAGSSSAGGAGAAVIAPVGAILGAAALVLL